MTRPDGFPVLDLDTGFLSDARVLYAVRKVGTDAVVVYLATVATSWARGERVPVDEALDRLPRAYTLDGLEAILDVLEETGLLTDGRIPEDSWDAWYGPAEARREARRTSGKIGGTRSGEVRRSKREATLEATHEANPKQTGTLPSVRPTSVLSDGPDGRPSAREEAGPDDRPRGPFGLRPKYVPPSGLTAAEDPDKRSLREKVRANGGPDW